MSYEQQKLLNEEFSLLQQGGELPKNSPYISLCPFFDKDFNVIRVGGRLANSDNDSLKKFPLLLPKTSSLVPLIIRYFHEATLHGGDSMTLAALRETYWIIGVRIMIRKIIKNCIKCCRFSLKSTTQQMADLPLERITPSRPFSQSGLDFAGPLKVKCSGKVYIAIFVCLSTKAVHMELVGNLSKDACILALKRFFARKGTPSKILSDNGTNFIGARNDLLKLKEVFESKNKDSVVSFAEQRGPEWVTIPARAPHFGGIWEAAVKSMKHHLRRVVGTQILHYEELSTILCQIEAVLNSRPLVPLSSDPNDLQVITPNHFLIGGSPNEPDRQESKIPLNCRYRLLQQIQKDFWKMWKKDYLGSLQIRKKWAQSSANLKIGDLVLLADDDCRAMQWKIGRIKEVYTGNDGLVRVVKVKTQQCDLIRPIVKLRKLPISCWL